jgi:hypothetical protein
MDKSFKQAYKYYQMSLILLPHNGMPLNQLGTLYSSENYGCDAAYYYLYCLSCIDPFVSARENLNLLFLKNRKRYDEIRLSSKTMINDHLVDENTIRNKEIKKFLVLFLHVIEIILNHSAMFNSSPNQEKAADNLQQLQELCQLCLQEFNSCLFHARKERKSSFSNEQNKKAESSEAKFMTYLPDDLVFKLTLIILMTVEQLKSKKQVLNNKTPQLGIYFTSVAFALLFFSHILNHAIMRIQTALLSSNTKSIEEKLTLEKENQHEEQEKKDQESGSSSSTSSDSDRSKKVSKQRSKNKKKTNILFGRRRRAHNSDSETNEEDSESSDLSSDQESDKSSRGSKGRRKAAANSRRRNSNIASFLEREDLSETELNKISVSGSDLSSDNENSSLRYTREQNKEKEPFKEDGGEKNNLPSVSLTPYESIPFAISQTELEGVNQAAAVNFRQFSTQLYSRFESLYQNLPLNSNLSASFSSTNNSSLASSQVLGSSGNFSSSMQSSSTLTEDFIDNEIYRFILNGNTKKSILDVPPGFEMVTKEALENEELGKKIATFQIETDTEMSIFNTDADNNSSSDSEFSEPFIEGQDDDDEDENDPKQKSKL